MFSRLTPVVKNILLINVGVFLLQKFMNLDLINWFGLRVAFADEFMPHQFLSYMWIHGGFMHLLGNMFAVFIFGPLLEQVWGPKRFLTFYLVCGIGAGVLFGVADYVEKYPMKRDAQSYRADPNPEDFKLFILDYKLSRGSAAQLSDFGDDFYDNPRNESYIRQSVTYVNDIYKIFSNIPMVGASGAVFGILMAFGMLFPNTVLYLLFPPIPIKAKYFVMFYAAYEVYAEIARAPGDNVAHLAHLGGMLIAFILIRIWQTNVNRFY